MIRRHRIRKNKTRRAAAVVEFAVCLPVILLIVFGAIKAASLLFLKQTLVQASYEGAKVAIRNGSQQEVEEIIRAVTDGRDLQDVSIEFDPPIIENTQAGDVITVRVSVSGDSNSPFTFAPFRNIDVAGAAVFVKE